MTRPVPNGALRRFKASIIIGAAEAGAALFVRISMVALEGTANHVAKRAGQTERTDKRRHYVRHSGRRWWWAGDNATASRTHSSRKKRVETRRGKRAREREEMKERRRNEKRGEEKKGSNLPYFFPSHLVSAATLVSPPPPPTARPISFRMTADQPILLFRFICRSQMCAVCLRVRFIIISYCACNPIQ